MVICLYFVETMWYGFNFECRSEENANTLEELIHDEGLIRPPVVDSGEKNPSYLFGVVTVDKMVYAHTYWIDSDILYKTAEYWNRAVHFEAEDIHIEQAILYEREGDDINAKVSYGGVEEGYGFGLIAAFDENNDFRFRPCAHTSPIDELLPTAETDIDTEDIDITVTEFPGESTRV